MLVIDLSKNFTDFNGSSSMNTGEALATLISSSINLNGLSAVKAMAFAVSAYKEKKIICDKQDLKKLEEFVETSPNCSIAIKANIINCFLDAKVQDLPISK